MISVSDPPDFPRDPEAEFQRTELLVRLRTEHDEAVTRLQWANRRRADGQAALSHLQAELNQVRTQLPRARQDAAASRATADVLKPRIDELHAAHESLTAHLL